METGGIHFHHFWYGLIMVLAAGWLGIASKPSIYRRIYAIIFGLGAGLIGDEVGLLLTFGNYFAEPTYVVFIAGVSVAALAVLIFGFKQQVSYDVLTLKRAEQLLYVGVVVSGLSALAFSVGQLGVGAAILAIGIAIAGVGVWLHRRGTAPWSSTGRAPPAPASPISPAGGDGPSERVDGYLIIFSILLSVF